jgi:COP9 signalosome complex subunit 5
MGSKMAQNSWEMANNVETIQSIDEIYKYNRKQQQDILTAKPWEKEYVFNQSIIN